jgi:tetratricopeptide (TPR) repeat protein
MATAPDTATQLNSARHEGDLDKLAEALAVHASTLVNQGHVAEARALLDEAAAIHHQRGRSYDEARTTQFAATLSRLEGKRDEAAARARHAAGLVAPNTPIAISAATELGEQAMARGDANDAAGHYAEALAGGAAAGMVATARAALLRKRAIALSAANRHTEAAADLTAAHDLLLSAGDATGALRTLIELATALARGGRVAESQRVGQEAMQTAVEQGDHHAQADLSLLEASLELDAGDAMRAKAASEAARTQALAARAPISYLSAVIALADLASVRGDRTAAYESLAVGWVTLGDLTGRDFAKAAFEPKLLALRERWGPVAFDRVKSAYEAKRRATLRAEHTRAAVPEEAQVNHR